jgi:hypothetical protein
MNETVITYFRGMSMKPMRTTRNNLEVIVMRGDSDALDEIDCVYEFANDEFLNDQPVHAAVSKIIADNRYPEIKLSEFLVPHVRKVAKREGFMAGSKDANFVAVANQLAADFNSSLGADIRREQRRQADADVSNER